MPSLTATTPGLVRAIVSNNRDPLGRGRIRFRAPSVLGSLESEWAEPSMIGSATPPLGAHVWVSFQNGDPAHPVWISMTRGSTALGDVDWDALPDAIITAQKLADEAVVAGKIAANAVDQQAIADAAVIADKLADGAVTSVKIDDQAVDVAKLADGSVSADKILPNAVVFGKIAADAVGADQLVANAVVAGKIAADAVDANAIQAGSISAAKMVTGTITAVSGIIGDAAIGTAQIADLAVNNAKIALLAVGTANIGNGAIVSAKIGDAQILTAAIADAQIVNAKIADATILSAKIADAQITNAKIGLAAVDTANIKDAAIVSAKIGAAEIKTANIDSLAVVSAKIGDLQVNSLKIGDTAVTTDKIYDTAVSAPKIGTDAVTTPKIDTGAVTNTEVATDAISSVKIVDTDVITAKLRDAGVLTAKLYDGAVVAAKLADNAVETAKIYTGAVVATKIFDGAVVTAKLDANAVTLVKMATDSVDSAQIVADAIKAVEIAVNAVGTAEIDTDAVDTAEIKADAVSTAEIATDAVAAAEIQADAVIAAKIKAGEVVAGKLSSDSVVAANIQTGQIQTIHMVAGTINADRLISGSVTTTQITAGSINADRLVAGSITTGLMTANTISGDRILANTLDAAKIVANSITTSQIAAGQVNADRLVAGSITSDRMTANTIAGDRILANSLDAAKIVAGSITSDRMTANTISGDRILANSLDAAKIVAGSITTDRMTANSISGDRIAANTLDAVKILAGSITATQVAANSLSADRLTIGVTTNLLRDAGNNDTIIRNARIAAAPTGWSILGPSADTKLNNPYYWNYTAASGLTSYYMGEEMPVQPGQLVRYSAWINHDATANGEGRLVLRFRKADGTVVWGSSMIAVISPATATAAGGSPALDPVDDGWQFYVLTLPVPDDCVLLQAKFEVAAFVRTGYTTVNPTAGNWQFAQPELSIMWGVLQSSTYAEGVSGWLFSDEDSQVEQLTVINGLNAASVDTETLVLSGDDLGVDIIPALTTGLTAYGSSSGNGWTLNSAAIGTTETGILTFQTGPLKTTRRYMIMMKVTLLPSSAGSTRMYLRYTTDGTTPTTSSGILDGSITDVHHSTTDAATGLINVVYRPGADWNNVKFLLSIRRVNSGTVTAKFDDANYSFQAVVYDIGLDANNKGILTQKSKSSGSADADPVQSYTTSWSATWSRSFDSDSSARSPDTDDCYQGYYSSTHGNTRAMVGFNVGSVGVSNSIRNELNGATITSVKLTFKVKHAYYNAGLRVRIGTHNVTNRPSTFSNVTTEVYDSGDTNKKEGSSYTVTLPNSVGTALRDGTVKGITFGPGESNSLDWYGYIYGANVSSKPKLTISYTK